MKRRELLRETIINMVNEPGIIVGYTIINMVTLRDVLLELNDIIREMGYLDLDFEFDDLNLNLTINKSVLKFIDTRYNSQDKKFDRFAGYLLTYLIVDEYEEEGLKHLKTRVGRYLNTKYK